MSWVPCMARGDEGLREEGRKEWRWLLLRAQAQMSRTPLRRAANDALGLSPAVRHALSLHAVHVVSCPSVPFLTNINQRAIAYTINSTMYNAELARLR